ncbi:restriction endonuclease subunit S [Ensifer sp. ENS12]|uniref:restriction endonuclease subunit S n=1 Tax=Ensifer sp. ENS12 TaxID=2854774 RepID=UPI001C43C918|nr:restriction endonuclease subunit S [Ensifer sp. ENS12]MBV7522629.1 restriction endonuclease subunit S [Ensifer sp. ENS12]
MTQGWITTTLGNIAASGGSGLVDGPFGSNLPASFYREMGVPVIRGSNLALGPAPFKDNDFVFVDEATAKKLSRSLCRSDDIIFTKKGTLGQTGFISRTARYPSYLLSSNQMKLTVDCKVADPRFVYYYVSSRASIAKIIRDAEATGVPKTNVAYLRTFPIQLPPVGQQRLISSALSSLDDKIELNRQMNETLEAMAQAIFRDWFIDFGPTRCKIEGASNPVEIMGGLVTDAVRAQQLADLFPVRFGDSGLPEGWEEVPFGQLIDVVGGGTPKTSVSEYWGGDVPWFSVVDTPPKGAVYVDLTEKSITVAGLENSSARLIEEGTTIISARGTVGNLAIAAQPMTFNQSCYALKGKAGIGNFFVFLASQGLVERLKGMAHGSVFSTITRATFDSITYGRPSEALLSSFEQVAEPLFRKIKANVAEQRTLAVTRDLLLPRLMSGEIRLPEAGEVLEAAQ